MTASSGPGFAACGAPRLDRRRSGNWQDNVGEDSLCAIYIREQFEPLCVMSNIEDAWDLVHTAKKRIERLVVLYDISSGDSVLTLHASARMRNIRFSSSSGKFRRSPNLRLIFTTREYIPGRCETYPAHSRPASMRSLKSTLSLEDYSRAHRAQMLFNHLYFSSICQNSRLSRFVEHRARKIVEHAHFNPQIVETISKYANSRALSDAEYIRLSLSARV